MAADGNNSSAATLQRGELVGVQQGEEQSGAVQRGEEWGLVGVQEGSVQGGGVGLVGVEDGAGVEQGAKTSTPNNSCENILKWWEHQYPKDEVSHGCDMDMEFNVHIAQVKAVADCVAWIAEEEEGKD